MNTFAAPTSVPDFNTAGALARAGWSLDDWHWETCQERAADAAHSGNWDEAAVAWAAGLRIGRRHFPRNDPRLAASLTNQAAGLARGGGGGGVAADLLDEALTVWDGARLWVMGMTLANPARSSIYHLRMQLRHMAVYDRRERGEWLAALEAARTRTQRLREAGGIPAGAPDPDAWREAAPAGFSDTRKLMAALHLIVPA